MRTKSSALTTVKICSSAPRMKAANCSRTPRPRPEMITPGRLPRPAAVTMTNERIEKPIP
jgi:hypothetical protein